MGHYVNLFPYSTPLNKEVDTQWNEDSLRNPPWELAQTYAADMHEFYRLIRHYPFSTEANFVSLVNIPHPVPASVFQWIQTFLLSVPTKDSSSRLMLSY